MKQRADGRYCQQIVIGKDINNKKIVKTVYGKSPEEVKNKLAAIRVKKAEGLDISSDKTFSYWCDMFLENEKYRLTGSEYKTKKARLSSFRDDVGNMPIQAIKPLHIESFLRRISACNPRTKKPMSEKTLREYRNVISQAFKFAIKNRTITYNPADFAEIPKAKPKKKRRALSTEEREHLDCLTCQGRMLLMTACYSGLRKGELVALTWNDVDFKSRMISVNKSWDFKTSSVKTPKTEAGKRLVPLTDKLYDELYPHRSKGLVFTYNDKRLTDAACERLLVEALEEINKNYGTELPPVKVGSKYQKLITIKPFGYHDLRHTYASLLYQSGVDVYSAKEILGHANIQTTLSIYTHLQKEQRAQSIEKLNEFLQSDSQDGQSQTA